MKYYLLTALSLVIMIVILFYVQITGEISPQSSSEITNDANGTVGKSKIDEDNFINVQTLDGLNEDSYFYDSINKSYAFQIGPFSYSYVSGTGVLMRNGYGYPVNAHEEGDGLYLSIDSAVNVFPYTAKQKKVAEEINSRKFVATCQEPKSAEDVQTFLSPLSNPMLTAPIPSFEGQLVGGERGYRNGIHQGIDWYIGANQQSASFQTSVYSMTKGIVIRIDGMYEEMTRIERNRLLDEAASSKETPEYILDKLRGRQIWIQRGDGVLIRYAHLNGVNPKLEVGDWVNEGEFIGFTGNSGTSDGALRNGEGVHLHSDILVCGKHFWSYYSTFKDANENIPFYFQ